MNIDTGINEGDLLAALVAEFNASQRQPGDFSLSEFCAASGRKRETARKFIAGKVADGYLKQVEITENAHRVTVYRKA